MAASSPCALSLVPLLVGLLWQLPSAVQGGHCWSVISKDGRCNGQLMKMVTKEQCCSSGGAAIAWNPEDYDSGRIFFWTALGGGVPNCQPCKESCSGMECAAGERCVIRKSQPRCVCAPDCSKYKRKGPICGADGRTYRSYCALLKRSCRKNKQISVAYHGPCQKSCESLICPGKKQCLLDQNLTPHCVRCSRPCPASKSKNFVCGVDGVTYSSFCQLRQAACQRGRAIPVAYQGKCKAGATCDKVRCAKGKTCLTEPSTGKPRCTTCPFNCKDMKLQLEGPICGSNNHTYTNWCHMMQSACDTGFIIETKGTGRCEDNDHSTHEPNSIPVLDKESSTSDSKS